MTLYIYRRVSSNGQEDGTSLETQRERCAALCTLLGVKEQPVVVTDVVSGSVPLDKRPGGAEMCASLKRGDRIIVAKLDRMFRSALDALRVLDQLRVRKVALHMLDLGGYVTGNGISKLVFTILSAVAEAERDRIRERIGDVKRDQRQRGRFLGGRRPVGYRVGLDGELVEDASEQAALAKARELRAQGLSLRRIGTALAEEGVTISRAALHRALAEESYRAQP